MIDYQKALTAARHRAQMIRNNAAERFALARSPIRYAPSESARSAAVAANAATALGLCPHGKVPRLVALKMNMPQLACHRCA